uniref:PGG domain-containing protein n=1 Tax=Aegilops tauschii subsp. strangulata TaxID=200361 RepID=A0A453APX8_AEGTS
MLLATLAASRGTPPGGFWPDNDAGELLVTYPRLYKAFFYLNATPFWGHSQARFSPLSQAPLRN